MYKRQCHKSSLKPIIITFDPHPFLFFHPKKKGFLIDSMSVRIEKLKKAGFSDIIILEFDKYLQEMDSKTFLNKHILDAKQLRLIYLGHDFKLGKGKENSKELLRKLASEKNIVIKESPPILFENTIISSSVIREALLTDISRVKSFLGENFSLNETVIKGKGLGKKELFPTCNITVIPAQCIPSFGVYLTKVSYNNQEYDAITNIGINPTITTEKTTKIETHIFFFENDIYGENIKITFISKIRDEKKFDSIKALREQISLDMEKAKTLHRNMSEVKLALIGKDISHSKSQEIYEKLLGRFVNYELIDCVNVHEIPSLEDLSKVYRGVSITSPYKTHFIEQVKLYEKDLPILNTLVFESKYMGANTDYLACQDIIDVYLQNELTDIHLLGDGSMAMVLERILTKKKIQFTQYSRKLGNLEYISDTLSSLKSDEKHLVINSCSREYTFIAHDSAM